MLCIGQQLIVMDAKTQELMAELVKLEIKKQIYREANEDLELEKNLHRYSNAKFTKKKNQFYLNITGEKGMEDPFELAWVFRSNRLIKDFKSKSRSFQIDYLTCIILIGFHEYKSNEDPFEFYKKSIDDLISKHPFERFFIFLSEHARMTSNNI